MNKIITAIAVIVVLVLAGLGVGQVVNVWPNTAETREVVTLGIPPGEYSALIYVADDQDYFSHNGLNVTIRNYDTGVAAIQGMQTNEVNISLSSEYPVIAEIFNRKNISIIGCIDKYETVFLVSRKESGIANVSDLKGKKVGVSRRTQGEFFLGRFLELRGMNLLDVTLVDISYTQSVDVLANGSVDACIVRGIDVPQVEERLGSSVIVWPVQSNQASYVVMTGRNYWIDSHPETLHQLLRSLAQAEQYTRDHPNEAKAIVQTRLNYTDAYIETVWPNNQFSLTLDQSLLIAMEDEARWMIANNLTSATTLPNFRDYVSIEGLLNVKPAAVTIR